MQSLSDTALLELYREASHLQLETEFLELLNTEIRNRNLKNPSDSYNYASFPNVGKR